jgi:hypothetical protein
MIYLRALFRFRLFVGGHQFPRPSLFQSFHVAKNLIAITSKAADFGFEVAKLFGNIVGAFLKLVLESFKVALDHLEISQKQFLCFCHSRSLTPEDRERNRPLVLQYAGGKL